MKTHFFLKALAEGDPDGCGRKVQMDFDMDFGFSAYDEEQTCEDLATCFSNFLQSLGYAGSFRYRPMFDAHSVPPDTYVPPDGNPSMAHNPDDDDEATLNKLRQPNPEKEGTNGK